VKAWPIDPLDLRNLKLEVSDECYLVLFHTHLFTFVRPLALLIFNNLTCIVCFVINRPLHHALTEEAKMDMK
jgi:hypothetical protein